jgi:hypothetical protein
MPPGNGPPPLPPIQGLIPQGMRPLGLNLRAEQMLAFLLPPARDDGDPPPDSDQSLPPSLRRYAAGLRPSPRPTSAPWQQEIVFERLGKTDAEIKTAITLAFDTQSSRADGWAALQAPKRAFHSWASSFPCSTRFM